VVVEIELGYPSGSRLCFLGAPIALGEKLLLPMSLGMGYPVATTALQTMATQHGLAHPRPPAFNVRILLTWCNPHP
jgi:hypothetical protein